MLKFPSGSIHKTPPNSSKRAVNRKPLFISPLMDSTSPSSRCSYLKSKPTPPLSSKSPNTPVVKPSPISLNKAPIPIAPTASNKPSSISQPKPAMKTTSSPFLSMELRSIPKTTPIAPLCFSPFYEATAPPSSASFSIKPVLTSPPSKKRPSFMPPLFMEIPPSSKTS